MSKRFFIENARVGVSDGYCGSSTGTVNVVVKYNDGIDTKWLTVSEVFGIPNFFVTNFDIFDKIMKKEWNAEFTNLIECSSVDEFEGIKLGEYSKIEEELDHSKDNPASALIKYVIELTIRSDEETKQLITSGEGKFADQITY